MTNLILIRQNRNFIRIKYNIKGKNEHFVSFTFLFYRSD